MIGRSTTVSISLGIALVAGSNRVPSPATGKMALRIGVMVRAVLEKSVRGRNRFACAREQRRHLAMIPRSGGRNPSAKRITGSPAVRFHLTDSMQGVLTPRSSSCRSRSRSLAPGRVNDSRVRPVRADHGQSGYDHDRLAALWPEI